MKKPNITLKNIKHHAGLSQETHAFTATVYVDGKKFATVENAGHGGPDNHHPVSGDYKDVQKLNSLIGETFPRRGFEYNPEGYKEDLDGVICDLVNEFLHKREFKKTLKKIAFIEDGKIYTLKAKYKPTPEALESVAKAEWAKNVTLLNTLPETEAFELFKAHS